MEDAAQKRVGGWTGGLSNRTGEGGWCLSLLAAKEVDRLEDETEPSRIR